MKRFQAKLKNSSGASMVIALIFLLISLVLGAIILSAASANHGRFSHIRAQQQDYLTTSSAADLMRAEIQGLTFIGARQFVHDSATDITTSEYLDPTISSNNPIPLLLREMAQQMLESQESSEFSPDITESLTINVPDFDTVTALLTIDKDYTITVSLSLVEERSSNYPLVLHLDAKAERSVATTVTSYEKTKTRTETVDGTPTEVTYTVTYYITTTTHTLSVFWNDAAIAKEGA
jgi:hypothetical protein